MIENNRFQRQGSHSNARVGVEFEQAAKRWLAKNGIVVTENHEIEIGFEVKKLHRFDLGSKDPAVIVECKSHKWTEGDKVPSAKMTVWNEAMLYFSLAPPYYRKILFVLKDFSTTRRMTLAAYYARAHGHLIPENVEMWEYDESSDSAEQVLT